MSASIGDDAEFPNQLSSVDKATQELRHRNNLWRSNYHEASIYIEEGLNNDKFENHPRKRATLAAVATTTTPTIATELGSTTPLGPASDNNKLTTIDLNQTTPLVSCVQKTPNSFLNTNNNNNNDNKNNNGFLNKKLNSNGSGGRYLLGGQYTTIETYILVHNRYFYQLDLIASIILLLLALFEPPAIEGYELNPAGHAAIEMIALGIIAIELLLKFRWMGPRRFFRHGRTVIKLIVLLTMNIEAIVIFLRHSTHARYSRALRPIFLFDNHYCHGMRRAIRQIFQSLPPILDMFTLAMFFMFVFSIFGFYLFASNNPNFSDMPSTVGNLLILATTANLPDIMMPSYAISRWSTIFFVLFIIIHLFLLTNLTMAAVYESFTRKEKEKFHKLLLHRRKACQKAFELLVSRRQPNRIQYRQFMGLMRYLNRNCSMFDAYLTFKAIDTDKNGSISLEEFYQIYDFINLEWKLIYPEIHWYDNCPNVPNFFKYFISIIQKVLQHKYFEWAIDVLIAASAFLQFIEATAFEFKTNDNINNSSIQLITSNNNYNNNNTTIMTTSLTNTNTINNNNNNTIESNLTPDSISTTIFICLFTIEAIFRCLSSGLKEFWQNRWNRFDCLVLCLSISGLISGYFGGPPFGWLIVMRVLRLMRLFEFKRRYRDMWQTLTYILLKRFVGMTCVVMILYYFFGIIGMELLSDYDLRNCCKNTSLESQFKFDNSTEGAKYYLNDFGDIVASYLTLFSMSSNTYWLATMTAYSLVAQSDWIRLFFGFYYLCSIIVMNIVIAFILESFLFRMHYRSKMGNNCDDTNLFTVRVTLSSTEVAVLRKNLNHYFDKNLDKLINIIYGQDNCCTCNCCPSSSTVLSCDKKKTYNDNKDNNDDQDDDERIALISKEPKIKQQKTTILNNNDTNNIDAYRKQQGGGNNSDCKSMQQHEHKTQTKRWYLIYQAEQIRNKFSFTMKMYADEVEGWLAEAERADQDEMTMMISRNQIRAEHVAMARLARRSIVAGSDNVHLLNGIRGRSWSSGSGFVGSEQHQAKQRQQQQQQKNNDDLDTN